MIKGTLPSIAATVTAGAASTAPADRLAWPDEQLAIWLGKHYASGNRVTLVFARHLCKFFAGTTAGEPLELADPDAKSVQELKLLVKNKLLFKIEVDFIALENAVTADNEWITQAAAVSPAELKQWNVQREKLFSQGRGKSLSDRSQRQVWYEAGARCMYRGCGNDVGKTSLTTLPAPAAYLAHIVASDEDGPRGNPEFSHSLSDNPDNVMLMCDEHHRLIDRIDVNGHSCAFLNAMRAEHVSKVRSLLDTLSYKHTRGIAILSDVGNIKTSFHPRDMREAMLQRLLSPAPEIDQTVRRIQRDDRLAPDYWQWVLHEHENDLNDLSRRLGATQALGDQVGVLSVFPLHMVPILVLCGRIVGEARQVEVFQYHRSFNTWKWNPAGVSQSAGFFFLDVTNCITRNQYQQVVLSLELTAEIDSGAFPDDLKLGIEDGSIPWIRVRAKTPRFDCIGHPEDLIQYTTVARDAMRYIQDALRATTIHLIGISPASALFRFGQILQAGHHPTYVVYDRPNGDHSFLPALCITGQQVHEACANETVARKVIPLR